MVAESRLSMTSKTIKVVESDAAKCTRFRLSTDLYALEGRESKFIGRWGMVRSLAFDLLQRRLCKTNGSRNVSSNQTRNTRLPKSRANGQLRGVGSCREVNGYPSLLARALIQQNARERQEALLPSNWLWWPSEFPKSKNKNVKLQSKTAWRMDGPKSWWPDKQTQLFVWSGSTLQQRMPSI